MSEDVDWATPDSYLIKDSDVAPLPGPCDTCPEWAHYTWRGHYYCTPCLILAGIKGQIPGGSTIYRVPVYEAA